MFGAKFVVLSLVFSLVAQASWARELEPLDPTAPQINRVAEDGSAFGLNPFWEILKREVSDLKSAIANQSVVKAQGHRGTCSIFSANGTLESLLKIELGKELDLSENYLEYLVMNRMKSYPSEGSDTPLNIPAFKHFGTVFSTDWPYEEYDWTEKDLSEEEAKRAEDTCGTFLGRRKAGCLLTHMDPENDLYAQKARVFKDGYGSDRLEYQVLRSQTAIKNVLDNNRPLILSVEFFYKAWNHRLMTEYGLGQRNMELWTKGTVGTPTAEDIRISRQHPAGHSFVLVGYNDQARVYYIKNSWGTHGFGENSDLLGAKSTAGYGTISYDYAHNFGTIYEVWFNRKP